MTAANYVPPSFIDVLFQGDPSLASWGVAAVANDYDPANSTLDDYDVVSDVVPLTGVGRILTDTTWDLTADDPTLTGIDALDLVEAVVLFIDTGDPATSPIAAYWGRRADTTAVQMEATGADLEVSWPAGFVIRL